ncbi:MAG: FAD:protein FMN transferase [Thermoanaerobaculia bacterium]|nr:FAD:protein FMN transferase [Thermoanaerobaculia bacterium]
METLHLGGARLRVAAVALLLCGAAPATLVADPSSRVERTVHLMGTTLRLMVEADNRTTALIATERMVSNLEASERRLSTWIDKSELSRINNAESEDWVPLSASTIEDLLAAERCRELSNGGFDPGIGRLVEAWDLRGGGRHPDPSEIQRALRSSVAPAVEIHDESARRRHHNLRIDEGGFGKGAAIDRALAATTPLPGIRSLRIDLGGQVTHWKLPATDAVADPRDRSRSAVIVDSPHPSLATSANSEHRKLVSGTSIGHLLDPRRGYPAEDFGSVTVWTTSALDADCLSTGLYALGPDVALRRAEELDGVEIMILSPQPTGDLLVRYSSGLEGRVRTLDSDSLAATSPQQK